ncbi:MAG: flagellar hook-length control protein FliK [Candidatus Sedimenticola sp. (ex Thyasira tokunagai)]
MNSVEFRRSDASPPPDTATRPARENVSGTSAGGMGTSATARVETTETLRNMSLGLKFFITQAGNINQIPQVHLFVLGIDMKIADLITNPKLAIEQTRSEMLSHLRPGQTVKANVLELPKQGIARLRIGTAEILVQTRLSLSAGEQLLLDVTKAKNSEMPELRLIQQPTLKHYQARALRTLLPQQIPLRSLVESIRHLVSGTPGRVPTPTMETKSSPALANPIQRTTQPHRQLIQTLRSLAPETIRNTPFPSTKTVSDRSITENSGRLPGRFIGATKTEQLLQRLVESRLPNSPAPAPTPAAGRASSLLSPAPSIAALSRFQHSLPNYPAITLPVLSKAVTVSSAKNVRMHTPIPGVADKAATGTPREILGSDIMQRVQAVLSHSVNDSDPLSASRIRQAFGTSGLFLESTLASGTAPTVDMKASLLQLLLHLRPGSGNAARGKGQQARDSSTLQATGLRILADLQTLTEGVLARIQVNQLTSLPQDEGTRQVWQFELPFVMPNSTDSFLIRIEREGKNNDESGGWAVTLQFNLEPLGPMSARLSLVEDEISSHFTAQLPESAKQLERALPLLSEAYIRAGLKVGKLSCRQGAPADLNTQLPPIDLPLLDEKA